MLGEKKGRLGRPAAREWLGEFPTTCESSTRQTASQGGNHNNTTAGPQTTQAQWLTEARGQRVQVRLLDAKLLEGTLLGWDQFTILLQSKPDRPPILLYKQSLAYITRQSEAPKAGLEVPSGC